MKEIEKSPKGYEKEARARWGHTRAYEESHEKTQRYTSRNIDKHGNGLAAFMRKAVKYYY